MLIPVLKPDNRGGTFQSLSLKEWKQMSSDTSLSMEDMIAELMLCLNIEQQQQLNICVLENDFSLTCINVDYLVHETYRGGLVNRPSASVDSVDSINISNAAELFQMIDSGNKYILLLSQKQYELMQHLFHSFLLFSFRADESDVHSFLSQLNHTYFTNDCPCTINLDKYKAHIASSTASFVLCTYINPAQFICDRMALGGADLHIHTTASDSSDTPEEVCRRVLTAGLRTFAITDHDNTEAASSICACLNEAEKSQSEENIPVYIPGVEISVQEERELHLLAYYPYGGFKRLQSFLNKQQQARDKRNLDMIATLQSLGYDISLDELNASGDHSVGRMQMALLLKARGYVKSTAQAFSDLLGYGRPGYIERPRPSLQEAICEIRMTGGVPVIAHPALYGWCKTVSSSETRNNLITRFSKYKKQGLVGIESFHGEAEKNQQQLLSKVALELQLLRTGGSDDHGRNKSHTNLYSRDIKFY